MMLDLRALTDFPARVTLEEDAARLGVSVYGMSLVGDVQVVLDVVKSDHIYFGTGQAVCDAQFECSRCLEPFRTMMRGEVEFSIQEIDPAQPVDRDEIPETELVIPAAASQVDITGPVREALLLEIPLKPLCAEDCRGLCPRCGVNRNERECSCRAESSDPRWDGLRDLL